MDTNNVVKEAEKLAKKIDKNEAKELLNDVKDLADGVKPDEVAELAKDFLKAIK